MGASNSHYELRPSRIRQLCISVKVRVQEVRRDLETQIERSEKQLMMMIEGDRCGESEKAIISSLMSDNIKKEAAEAVIRKADVLRDYADVLSSSSGDPTLVKDLLTFIFNIAVSNEIFHLDAIAVFNSELLAAFEETDGDSNPSSSTIDSRISRAINAAASPSSAQDINNYVNYFCEKHLLSIDTLNGINNNNLLLPLHEFTNIPQRWSCWFNNKDVNTYVQSLHDGSSEFPPQKEIASNYWHIKRNSRPKSTAFGMCSYC